MPTMETEPAPEIISGLMQLAEDSGFVVLDLSDAYGGHDPSSLIVAEWDRHPNTRGHQLLADHLYEALKAKAGSIPFNFSD